MGIWNYQSTTCVGTITSFYYDVQHTSSRTDNWEVEEATKTFVRMIGKFSFNSVYKQTMKNITLN